MAGVAPFNTTKRMVDVEGLKGVSVWGGLGGKEGEGDAGSRASPRAMEDVEGLKGVRASTFGHGQ